nr:MAG TPA: hypothetical protein [Caudoviricetes sp.]
MKFLFDALGYIILGIVFIFLLAWLIPMIL